MGIAYIDPERHPLLHSVLQGAQWIGEAHDEYPAFPEWADEHERWFEFIRRHGGWDYYVGRLRSPARRRDEELAEIAAAYFLGSVCGLPILEWQPPGVGNRRGDFRVGLLPFGEMFVEVKSPGWEADIAPDEEPEAVRSLRPKYVDAENLHLDPAGRVRETVGFAYPQIPDMRPTLLLLNDDFQVRLNRSIEFVKAALYARRFGAYTQGYLAADGPFVGRDFERLGAVGLLNVNWPVGAARPDFEFCIFRNANAQSGSAIPGSAFTAYRNFETRP